jgi:hypothetical protein
VGVVAASLRGQLPDQALLLLLLVTPLVLLLVTLLLVTPPPLLLLVPALTVCGGVGRRLLASGP